MDVLSSPNDVRCLVRHRRASGHLIGVVPTMGALHEGHLSLIRAARAECDTVVTTIFVNPTQFGPDEDFERYPRTPEADLELCREAGTSIVFIPNVDDMYTPDAATTVTVSGITRVFEGASRPTHFDGVTTVVAKLFHITEPDRAYFGQKDYQQQLVIRKMASDLNWPVTIVTCPVVRDADGLALSSRNRYLTDSQRRQALVLNQALTTAAEQALAGHRPWQIENTLTETLKHADGIRPDYAAVVDPDTLQSVPDDCRRAVALAAVWVGSTRLIDNRLLTFPET